MEVTLLGNGVEEVSIVPVVYPCGTVIISTLVFLRLLILLLNLLILLLLSLSNHATLKSNFKKKKRGR